MATNKIASSVFSAGPKDALLALDVYDTGDTLVKNALPALLSDTGNALFEALGDKRFGSLEGIVGIGEALTGKDLIKIAGDIPGIDILTETARLQGLQDLAELGKLTGISSLEAAGQLVAGDLDGLEAQLSEMTGGLSDSVLGSAEDLYKEVLGDLASTVSTVTGNRVVIDGETITLRGIDATYVTGAVALFNLYTTLESQSDTQTDQATRLSLARQTLKRAVYTGSTTLVTNALGAITDADIKLIAVTEAIKLAYTRGFIAILELLVDAISIETTRVLYPTLPTLVLAFYRFYSDMDRAAREADQIALPLLLVKLNPMWDRSTRGTTTVLNLAPFMAASEDALTLLSPLSAYRMPCAISGMYTQQPLLSCFNALYNTTL